ncbi:BNR repeat-containing protein [Paractinoplanes lichenicola]|uniref:BNR repeat-containing protein n=1 Tax=Paractinoplanes lichenicola TaxID=2802976 RepID=A0ABS1VFB0_9ACTN|nr:BNR repeat-containing protein [Actinoplanes lichenicola]MBL7253318.1 BNR repeat-containing protein [Actinoplanes lichenicola]
MAIYVKVALASVLAAVSIAVPAAPTVTAISTTVLTTNGRTALTYTGYMNGESFQQDGIVTVNGWQYAAFWDQDGYVNLSRRQLPSGAWANLRLTDYRTTSTDSHNTISIGIAPADGTIHLAFDTHSSVFRYRKSVAGLATTPGAHAWTADRFGAVQSSLTSTSMAVVTYPQFFAHPDGTLQLAIRTGVSGTGDEVLYEYRAGAWTYLGEFIDGTTYNNNAYLFGIEYDNFDPSGPLLHVTWTVRETSDAATNHDLFYAYSKDKGRTWRNSAGTVVATTGSNPLASAAANLKVWGIGQNRGLINQESQVVDAAGIVHVLASHLPAAAPSNPDFTSARETAVLVHYWRDKESKVWHQTYTPFLERSARGDIAVDANDNLYVASGDSSTRKLHIETASRASGWTDWTIRYTSGPVCYSDPLIDHQRLRSLGVLSIFAPRYGGSQIDVQDWRTQSS